MEFRGYTLYPFQEEAIRALEAGKSVIVSAPTGAGKTVIAEWAIEGALARGTQAIYTAPIKALSNQKFRDFRATHGDKIGLMTGDVTINGDAPILIMTTEIFRNTLFEDRGRFESVETVIMDEIHYIGDDDRGSVWEESIMFAPPSVRFVGLSATISNLEEFRAWVEKVRDHSVQLVRTDERPVPLRHWAWIPELGACKFTEVRDKLPEALAVRKRRRKKPVDILDVLEKDRKLPTLVFCFSRKECESRARKNRKRHLLTDDERRRVHEMLDDLGAKYGVLAHDAFAALRALADRGVLYHHAGMLPIHKEIVERLFTTGLIRLLFTTETFALGVNMPARTVVFASLRKFDGVTFDYLKTLNYYQMAGRAGRQGLDDAGDVYAVIDCETDDAKRVKGVVFNKIEPIVSRFNLSYGATLNLYGRMGEGIYEAAERSLAAWQRGSAREEKAVVRKRLEVLEDRGYIRDGGLTDKGRFAASLNCYEIAVTELTWAGCFEDLSPTDLVIMLMSLLYEPKRAFAGERPAPMALAASANRAKKRLFDFVKAERSAGLPESQRPPDFGLTAVVRGWMQGSSLEDVIRASPVQDGDLIRNFRLVLQVLRQLEKATQGHDALHDCVRKAYAALDRDEVDAEAQMKVN